MWTISGSLFLFKITMGRTIAACGRFKLWAPYILWDQLWWFNEFQSVVFVKLFLSILGWISISGWGHKYPITYKADAKEEGEIFCIAFHSSWHKVLQAVLLMNSLRFKYRKITKDLSVSFYCMYAVSGCQWRDDENRNTESGRVKEWENKILIFLTVRTTKTRNI